jgi:hypothetical protein
MKAIIAKVKPARLLIPLKKEFVKASKSIQDAMELTTVNFQQVSPTFLIEESKKGGDLIRVIGPSDDKDGLIWHFLSSGTSVRYAILSSDWESKTTPNTLQTGLGAGFVVKIDVNNPQPGIIERRWQHIIADVQGQKFIKAAKNVINKAKVFSN